MSKGQQIDLDQYGRLTGRLCQLLELVGIRRTKPFDPAGALAKALEAYAGEPVDDDDDGDEEETLPFEEGFDREPGEA